MVEIIVHTILKPVLYGNILKYTLHINIQFIVCARARNTCCVIYTLKPSWSRRTFYSNLCVFLFWSEGNTGDGVCCYRREPRFVFARGSHGFCMCALLQISARTKWLNNRPDYIYYIQWKRFTYRHRQCSYSGKSPEHFTQLAREVTAVAAAAHTQTQISCVLASLTLVTTTQKYIQQRTECWQQQQHATRTESGHTFNTDTERAHT